MQQYNYSNELYHYGVLGMKWGVRRKENESGSSQGKRHLGIDDKGNITITRNKTTKDGIKRFVIKSSITVGSLALTTYIRKHPDVIANGSKKVSKLLREVGNKSVKEAEDMFSGFSVYSKKTR